MLRHKWTEWNCKNRELDIPVFHNDQHAISILLTAALILKIVVSGAWAAELSACKILINFNPEDSILTNIKGIIYDGRPDLNPVEAKMPKITNKHKIKGSLIDALCDADVFIGVSAANTVIIKMIEAMNNDAIVFDLTNPVPEIIPEDEFMGVWFP